MYLQIRSTFRVLRSRDYNSGVADESEGFTDSMTSLGAALTSPAKLAFAGFVILAYNGKISGLSFRKFLVVAAVFLFVQVVHDDFLRIVLNRWAVWYSGGTALAQGVEFRWREGSSDVGTQQKGKAVHDH